MEKEKAVKTKKPLEPLLPGRYGRMDAAEFDKEVGKFDLGGITLTYGPDKNQGMDQVFFTVIQADGSFKPVDRLER